MNGAVFFVEVLVGQELFEHFVHTRDGEGEMELLLALAVGVQDSSSDLRPAFHWERERVDL